jgi:tetratricopeptide (TPR) repeat protein
MLISVTVTDNRESQIAGAVRSVVDHVDRILLVDTGVTDRTVERARDVAGAKLEVVRHPWTDFSNARNAGLEAAEQAGAKWIVIVDSDERLSFNVKLRDELGRTGADALLVESDDGHYPKEKILRAGAKMRYFGPTHEALLGGKRSLLRGVTFRELPKTDKQLESKCARDVALLVPFITTHPEDPRWRYYLGSALEGLGKHEQAAKAFGECARLRKSGYEAAWARYKEAEQLLELKQYDAAIDAAARGLRIDPTFAECACAAAEAALGAGRKDHAIAWARIAESVGRFRGGATERLWFRDLPSLYERPYEVLRTTLPNKAGRDLAELDFRAARLERVRAIDDIGSHDLDWMSVSRSVPASNREEARALLRPPSLAKLCRSARAVRIQFEPPGGRLPLNPSICRHLGEIWCVVRTINYSLNGRAYTVHDPHGVVRTENYLGRLKPDGVFVEPTLMRDLDPSPRQPSQIIGYEDVRLVSIKGRSGDVLAGSATVCDRDPNRRMIARLYLDAKGDVKRADVQPSNQLHEKNWMPLAVDGKFTYIYSLDPTAILPGPLRACPFALDHLRGGAAMPFGDGYLCVTHEVIDEPERRIYLHRFVRLDRGWNVTAVSPSWVFDRYGIEFCAGVVQDKGQIVLSYGVDDREAWIARVDVEEVEAMRWIKP